MQQGLSADRESRERLIVLLRDLLGDRSEIAFAFIFGSFLDQPAFRDIDIAIWTTPKAPPRVDVELAAHASAALGVPVDVRRVNDAPVSFMFHVLRGHPIVVRDEELLATLMERTAREYHDHAPLVRQATRDAFAR
jgi:predicted nucleotidyltransferase